ncbi:universal stress protein [Dactylosporangium sp. CS-047395]|uniref:universal stress protein n=1 Tax=Dactylosporangium sp. CS-047395 TaxID=3239936 RepID=UPI003D8B9271
MNGTRIIVGFDGSGEAHAAVQWAADEAERTHAQLQIVHTYQITWPGAYYDISAELLEEARRRGEQLIDEAVAQVRERGPEIDVIGTSVYATPAATLLDLADTTTIPDTTTGLLVVGNRGAGGISNLLLGSVSQQVATHANTPVVVVRGRWTATGGPVVVGVDGSASSNTALSLAFAAADTRGTEVVAIRAYQPPPQHVVPLHAAETIERDALEASLAPWRQQYPGVKVEALVAVGRPAQVLIGVSHTARLVVVGSRGHGGFTGLLLGSVGQQLMHHAECPVMIAHPPKPA